MDIELYRRNYHKGGKWSTLIEMEKDREMAKTREMENERCRLVLQILNFKLEWVCASSGNNANARISNGH
eukprot:669666-Amorphochlora_amoeboformis.AAC.1